jgi:hypothetical protein
VWNLGVVEYWSVGVLVRGMISFLILRYFDTASFQHLAIKTESADEELSVTGGWIRKDLCLEVVP